MIRKTFCRTCTSACGLLVDVEDDVVLSIRGDKDHALTEGYSCAKGRALGEVHHHENRLLVPKMRKDGVMQQAGWDEVLDDLAGKLRKIIDESGPDAVGIFLGGGCYMDSPAYATLNGMKAALGSKSFYSDMSIDVMSKIVVTEMMGGLACMPRPDMGRCKMVIYVGTNPVVSHGHTSMLNNPTQRLREFTAQGEVWVLDPRSTETAARATRHLVPRPGSDYAILAHLIRELLIDGADREYLDAHAQDVDKLAGVVAPYTAAQASALSGVAEADLADFLAAVRRAGRLSVESGTGISMSPAGNMTAWMAHALMIVTGSLDREGGAWVNPGFLNKLEQREIPSAPEGGWRFPGTKSRPELRTVAGEQVVAAMPDEIESGNLRALINLSGNLVTCFPDHDRFMAALGKLEVLSTIEIMDNAMVAMCTHAMPSKDALERPDISLAVDGSYSQIGVSFAPALVAPRGDVKSYWWILMQIGKRMGLDFFPGVDPDTTTDEDIVRMLSQGGRSPVETDGEGLYHVEQDRMFGWTLDRADAIGGFRLAPQSLVDQLAELQPTPSLVMLSRRQLGHQNNRFNAEKRDKPGIFVSRPDAEELGLVEGDQVLVRSAHGEIRGSVTIDRTLSRGMMSVPHGWEGQYNVNRLTSVNDIDSLTGMPIMSNLPVEIVRLNAVQNDQLLEIA